MVEATNTTGTTAGIWAIVIVAVVALATWLTAIILADRSQVRASGPRVPGESRPTDRSVSGAEGRWVGGSVAGAQAPEIPGEAEHEPIETPGQPAMPRQRTGEADRAGSSFAGPGTRDDEEPSR